MLATKTGSVLPYGRRPEQVVRDRLAARGFTRSLREHDVRVQFAASREKAAA